MQIVIQFQNCFFLLLLLCVCVYVCVLPLLGIEKMDKLAAVLMLSLNGLCSYPVQAYSWSSAATSAMD